MSALHLLGNIVWHALSGSHSMHATGTVDARRYAPGFSPIVGFADVERPNFDGLSPYCEQGEHFYCDGWTGIAPPAWRIDSESTMFKMVWDDALPDDTAPEAVRLDARHNEQALDLARLTQPGPFGPRTLELGDYFGFFDGPRLMAMSGERMAAGTLREVSGVCTHPNFQGHGMARRLVGKLVRRQLQRGEVPFLHVMRENTSARGLYRRMGFRDHLASVVRVISPG